MLILKRQSGTWLQIHKYHNYMVLCKLKKIPVPIGTLKIVEEKKLYIKFIM